MLQVSLCCLHLEENFTALALFNIRDFICCKILLTFVLLGEAEGSETLDLNKKDVEKLCQ